MVEHVLVNVFEGFRGRRVEVIDIVKSEFSFQLLILINLNLVD